MFSGKNGARYYYTDRNSAAIQAIDIPTLASVAKIQGIGATVFAGLGANSSVSGPDGLNAVGALLYAGDALLQQRGRRGLQSDVARGPGHHGRPFRPRAVVRSLISRHAHSALQE